MLDTPIHSKLWCRKLQSLILQNGKFQIRKEKKRKKNIEQGKTNTCKQDTRNFYVTLKMYLIYKKKTMFEDGEF